jgi:hypothetical protein
MTSHRTIRRLAAVLAGLTTAVLALGAASPAALAYRLPPHPGSGSPAGGPAHTLVTGGMPGWQITLIAAAAAVLAAVLAVLLDRARTARQVTAASS